MRIPTYILWALLMPAFPVSGEESKPFSFQSVVEKARTLASEEYAEMPEVPMLLKELNYDQYRAIEPAESATLWKKEGLPFRLEFFHPGYLFRTPVTMNLLDEKGQNPTGFPFDPERFDYSRLALEEQWDPNSIEGYAGFRIQFPLHDNPDNFDEIGSFVGSSYFRLLGQDQRYGISARGLALNVAHHEAPEEFPVFTEYWIIQPEPDAKSLRFYALLESPSVTGAFDFETLPGTGTDAKIEATLFFRKEAPSVGLAPLTSMFWYGENSSERRFPDWRPEVHDSDGLLFRTWNDETVWRPLFNDDAIRYTYFNAPDVKGFGLMQRDRDFQNYEDLSNPYHQTPTAWIQPEGKWGEGAVRLIELPTESEAHDNVVAFYEPKEMPKTGESLSYAYTLSFEKNRERHLSENRVEATRVGVDPAYPDTRRFVIDFNGPDLKQLPADAEIFAEITSGENGFIDENQCFKNVKTGGWRVEFKLDTEDDNTQPVELRCFLRSTSNKQILTETWSYQWSP